MAGAAFKGDALIAALLVEYGAEVDGAGPDGKTALMYAAMFDRGAVVDVLLARGARADHRDSQGHTALDVARAMGAQQAVTRLSRT